MEHDKAEIDERMAKKRFPFATSQILLWTAVAAVVVACVKYLPVDVYVLILLSFLGVPTIPVAILFATIALSPEKKGQLSVNHGSLKILVAAWFICVTLSASTCLLIYWGIVY
jgi:hypothetical protein